MFTLSNARVKKTKHIPRAPACLCHAHSYNYLFTSLPMVKTVWIRQLIIVDDQFLFQLFCSIISSLNLPPECIILRFIIFWCWRKHADAVCKRVHILFEPVRAVLLGARDLELRFANKRATSLPRDGQKENRWQFWFCCHMLSGNCQVVHVCIVVGAAPESITPNMDATENYLTTYDSKTKLSSFIL